MGEQGEEAWTFTLEIDDRERKVLPYVPKYFRDGETEVKRLARGDYAIVAKRGDEEKLVALVERKTHKDLASSIKDGRLENLAGMVEVREEAGCDLWLFAEGPAFPQPDTLYGRVPYSTLESVLLDASVREKFFVARTKDLEDGVRVLRALVERYRRGAELGAAGGAGNQRGLQLARNVRKVPNRAEIVSKMWGSLKGISEATGMILLGAGSFADWLDWAREGTARERLAGLRYPGGSRISANATASVLALLAGEPEPTALLYGAINGLSKAPARSLGAAWPLARLLSEEGDGAAAFVPQGRKTKIGPAMLEKMRTLLRHSV